MKLFHQKKKRDPIGEKPLLSSSGGKQSSHPFWMMDQYIPLSGPEMKLYESIREGIPIIDAAILKIVRLVGGIRVQCAYQPAQRKLDEFLQQVNVGGVSLGLESFISSYLESLLTYGNAVGEMVLHYESNKFIGLYHAPLSNLQIKADASGMGVDFYREVTGGTRQKIHNKKTILFTALNPKAGEYQGISVLRSLPFVTSILLKIFHAIGQNFDRVGNIRYAVTYKPTGDVLDKAYAKQRAELIAQEWSAGMRASAQGEVKDFITVGDVNISVIGADNQELDTNIPVRHLLEQVVAKMGIPPFLLGLSWSSTERMSQQQTDMLTTELEFYRRLLTPIILKICNTYLYLQGITSPLEVVWDTISLKDEIEQAHANLYQAQAEQIMAQQPKTRRDH